LAAPGASAVLTALSVAGLPTDKFFFAGFLPPKQTARRKAAAELAQVPGSLVFYESPKRVGKMLIDLVQELGGDRQAAVCRELTKKFEEVRRATLFELAQHYQDLTPKGEIVVVVGPAPEQVVDERDLEKIVKSALAAETSLKDAVAAVTQATGLPRKQVYKLALELENDK